MTQIKNDAVAVGNRALVKSVPAHNFKEAVGFGARSRKALLQFTGMCNRVVRGQHVRSSHVVLCQGTSFERTLYMDARRGRSVTWNNADHAPGGIPRRILSSRRASNSLACKLCSRGGRDP